MRKTSNYDKFKSFYQLFFLNIWDLGAISGHGNIFWVLCEKKNRLWAVDLSWSLRNFIGAVINLSTRPGKRFEFANWKMCH
jgi:hypothetical protein